MIEAPQAEINYVAGGSIGHPKVLEALVGDSSVAIQQIILPGYGLRMQKLEDIRQDFVRNALRASWDETGHPFYGATTLVESPRESTPVSLVKLTADQWSNLRKRLDFWNFHEDNLAETWFHYRPIVHETQNGKVIYLAEFLPRGERLHRLPRNYQTTKKWSGFIDYMTESVYQFRKEQEEAA
jgi:hypothetical protein